ncbi:MAG TPA: metal-sensitive transcriptional regulator [Atribacterota bacterium]|nr:metal-sensitive transcriptional regulator [Atribacterota bacterium]HOR41619.1 metal-sensitive transcriptional regulator [Atribacterota bacterium]HPK87322.1 metal-sensitive transcriptional regulator [Atribacterota bacterium]
MDIDEINKLKILHRLKKVEGQIRGIQSMLIDNRSCADILAQVSAVHSALNRIKKLLLEEKINAFFSFAEDDFEYQNSLDEIIELIIKFIK